VAQSDVEAARWFKKSAYQGNDMAQLTVGALFRRGAGVMRSAEEAVRWFKKSAERGNSEAQFNLAVA